MSTSSTVPVRAPARARAGDRMVLAEAAGGAVLVAGATALVSPDDLWLGGDLLHPAWLVIFLVSARYGTRGLIASLAFTWGVLAVVALATGGTLAGLAAHTRTGTDRLALIGATLVAWVAMLHESRMERADRRLVEAMARERDADATVSALHDALAYLRARHDRVDIALSLWRDLAGRIERGDAAEAASAILELCEIRVGAASGIVQLRDGNRLTTLAVRGQWSPTMTRPADIAIDRTVRAAIQTRRATPAGADATDDDCDAAVPVLDDATGVVVGVIALRGVAPGGMRVADLADLVVLAQWLAPALGRPLHITSPHKRLGEGAVS